MDALSRRVDAVSRSTHPASGSSRGAIPPPPFAPGAIKSSALYHIKKYQELFTEAFNLRIDSKAAEGSPTNIRGKHYDEENPDTAHETTAKRNIAQGLLLIDISRLIDGLTRLQGQLRRARVRKWLVHGTIALIWQVICVYIPHRAQQDGLYYKLKTWAQYLCYPFAIIRIYNYERQLFCTTAVEECVINLHGKVRRGDPINEQDFVYLKDNLWDGVPWSKLRDRKDK